MNKPFILTAEDRVKLHKKVLACLSRGKRNAIRGKELAIRLNQTDDRKIRLIIRELIAEGIPVASSVSEPMGFYLCANENEALDYIRVLKDRIREDSARLKDFEKACSEFKMPEQASIFG